MTKIQKKSEMKLTWVSEIQKGKHQKKASLRHEWCRSRLPSWRIPQESKAEIGKSLSEVESSFSSWGLRE
jgi:hypothetical protein